MKKYIATLIVAFLLILFRAPNIEKEKRAHLSSFLFKTASIIRSNKTQINKETINIYSQYFYAYSLFNN